MSWRRRDRVVLKRQPKPAALRGIAEAVRLASADLPPMTDAERAQIEREHAAVPYVRRQAALPLRLSDQEDA
jgi:hypothetical protein